MTALGPSRRYAWLLVACLWAGIGVPRVARACLSIGYCPISHTLPADGGQLPANLHGFLWRRPCLADFDFAPKLSAASPGGSARELAFEVDALSGSPLQSSYAYWVHWQDSLPAGTQLVFSYATTSSAEHLDAGDSDAGASALRRTVHWTVIPEAPRPERAGSLSVSSTKYGSLSVPSRDGDCAHELIASYVDVVQIVEPDAQPWRDALYYETRVDDTEWNAYAVGVGRGRHDDWLGTSSFGPDRDRIYVVCALPNHSPAALAAASVLAPGKHLVEFRSYLPDGSALQAASTEIELHCPVGAADGGSGDASMPAVSPASIERRQRGCAVSGPRPAPASSGVLLLFALAARRRRS